MRMYRSCPLHQLLRPSMRSNARQCGMSGRESWPKVRCQPGRKRDNALMTRLVTADVLTRLGAADAVLGFGGGKIGEAPPSKRTLQLDGTDAFELSFWCGTCPLLFERLAGANRTLSSDELADRLESRLDEIDSDVLRSASEVLPIGDYLPMLLDVSPNLVNPLGSGDYFAEEQVEHRGVDAFWGLPHDARTPYYRAGDRPVNGTGHLFEFVVPMVPPNWNDAARVEHY